MNEAAMAVFDSFILVNERGGGGGGEIMVEKKRGGNEKGLVNNLSPCNSSSNSNGYHERQRSSDGNCGGTEGGGDVGVSSSLPSVSTSSSSSSSSSLPICSLSTSSPSINVSTVELYSSVQKVEKVLQLISEEDGGNMQHPVCEECIDMIIGEVQRRVEEAEIEYKLYSEALQRLSTFSSSATSLTSSAASPTTTPTSSSPSPSSPLLLQPSSSSSSSSSSISHTSMEQPPPPPPQQFVAEVTEEEEEEEEYKEKEDENSIVLKKTEEEEGEEEEEEGMLVSAMNELCTLESSLSDERRRLLEELEELREAEDSFWLIFSEYQADMKEHEEELAATKGMISYASYQLSRLKKINVINDTFFIWECGVFGTINGFRFGRLASANVTWDETNAAWGLVCLLLEVIVKKCQINLSQFRLLPRGNFSVLIRKSDKTHLELFGSEGGLSRFFSGRRFDQGMSAFLFCVQEVVSQLQERFYLCGNRPLNLPFKIESDRIDGLPIGLQFNQEERWTKALKFLLIDLKYIVGFVENRIGN